MTRVLVCDAEPHVTRAISLRLNRVGYEVFSAGDLKSAWNQVLRTAPQVVIADHRLPGGGIALLEKLRESAATIDTPFILLTEPNTNMQQLHAETSGWNLTSVLSKPFSPRDLSHLIDELVHGEKIAWA